MKVGFFPNGSAAYPEVDLRMAFKAMAATGFTAVDIQAHAGIRDGLDSSGYPAEERRRIRAAAQKLGLEISAVITSPGLADTLASGAPLDLVSAIRLAVDVGARAVAVHPGGHTLPAASRPAAMDALRAEIQHAADAAQQSGVILLLDAIHPDGLLDSPARLSTFLESVDRPGVAWNADPAFLVTAGFDLVGAVTELSPWIRHVHLKGVHGRWPDPVWTIPGDGEPSPLDAVRALRLGGYDGAVVAEVVARPRGGDGTPRWPFEIALQRSFDAISRALGAAPSAVGLARG